MSCFSLRAFFFEEEQAQVRAQVRWPIAHTLIGGGRKISQGWLQYGWEGGASNGQEVLFKWAAQPASSRVSGKLLGGWVATRGRVSSIRQTSATRSVFHHTHPPQGWPWLKKIKSKLNKVYMFEVLQKVLRMKWTKIILYNIYTLKYFCF